MSNSPNPSLLVRCSNCNKLLFYTSVQHKQSNGKVYCDNCNFYSNRAKRLLYEVPHEIIENFIEKYGLNPPNKELEMLLSLVNKKYNGNFHIGELLETLHWAEKELNQERELKHFEIDLKYNKVKDFYCSICKKTITKKQFEYSMDVFGKALCSQHQKEQKASTQAKKLFNALQYRRLNCNLESSDGYKSVDIAIHDAKMYIEIDGSHHSTDPSQLKADLLRDLHSHMNGYVTKRLTNNQIDNNLEEIADALANVAKERIKQSEKK